MASHVNQGIQEKLYSGRTGATATLLIVVRSKLHRPALKGGRRIARPEKRKQPEQLDAPISKATGTKSLGREPANDAISASARLRQPLWVLNTRVREQRALHTKKSTQQQGCADSARKEPRNEL